MVFSLSSVFEDHFIDLCFLIQGVLKVGLRPPLVLCEEALIQLTSTKTPVSIALLSPARINVLSQVNPVLRDKSLKSFSVVSQTRPYFSINAKLTPL